MSPSKDKTVSRLKAAGFLLLPPCRGGERSEGAIGMGVEILIVLMLGFYPLPDGTTSVANRK